MKRQSISRSYKVKFSNFQLRACINILNECRLANKSEGESTSMLNGILLKLLDMYEA